MTNLNIGDTVRLKSGGPLMTVRALRAASLACPPGAPQDHVDCQWFDDKQISKIIRFPVDALDPASPSATSAR